MEGKKERGKELHILHSRPLPLDDAAWVLQRYDVGSSESAGFSPCGTTSPEPLSRSFSKASLCMAAASVECRWDVVEAGSLAASTERRAC